MDIKQLLREDLERKNRLMTIIIVIAATSGLVFNLLMKNHIVVSVTLAAIDLIIVTMFFLQKNQQRFEQFFRILVFF